jgi:hypothetical protein
LTVFAWTYDSRKLASFETTAAARWCDILTSFEHQIQLILTIAGLNLERSEMLTIACLISSRPLAFTSACVGLRTGRFWYGSGLWDWKLKLARKQFQIAKKSATTHKKNKKIKSSARSSISSSRACWFQQQRITNQSSLTFHQQTTIVLYSQYSCIN